MPVTDLKISLRKRNTDFASDGYRLLPITKTQYVDGLLGADGKIDPSLIPAWLYAGRTPAGIADLVDAASGGRDIDSILYDLTGFNFTLGSEPVAADGVAGVYVEITNAGELVNESARSAAYEIVGAGNAGDNTFPMELQTGDYIVLVRVNESNPKYSFAIVDNTYGDATTTAKGIVRLSTSVASDSTTLAATPSSVKAAYDLASSKEDAFTKNTAFNKNFLTGGNYGTATTPARSDHKHGTFGFTSAALGANIINAITVTDGVVTALTTQTLGSVASAAGLVTDTAMSDAIQAAIDGLASYVDTADATHTSNITAATTLAKKGLEYYTTVANADAGGHASGDIVAVLEA